MATEEWSVMIDNITDQLEQATGDSAAGTKSWDEFCKFLTNFEQLLKLHDPKDSDVAKLTKRKHICYYIAGDQVDKNQQMAAEILPKIGKLIQSDIFPREADFLVLCDWVQQVSFLLEMIWPENGTSDPLLVEKLDQNFSISSALIGLCHDRLKHERVSQLNFDWRVFDKTCLLIKRRFSQPLKANSKAIILFNQIASLMRDFQLAAGLSNEQFEPASNQLWSIVEEEFTAIVLDCTYCNRKMSKAGQEASIDLYQDTLVAIVNLPPNDQALKFFLILLSKQSRPESDTALLAMLYSILFGRNFKATNIWPILDIHMSRSEPNMRIFCLKIATGLVLEDEKNIGDVESTLKHLDLIIADIKRDNHEDCEQIIFNVIKLLCSFLPCSVNWPTGQSIRARLAELMKNLTVEHMTESNMKIVTRAIEAGNVQCIQAIEDVTFKKFEHLYISGVETKDRVNELQALYEVFANKYFGSKQSKINYIKLVAAGCHGVAPKGCNEAMFRILKKAVDEGEIGLCLLPLARAVYDQGDW